MARQCVYCGRTKEDIEFSSEHVIPDAVGGKLTPTNPFILRDVCTWCNNVCGNYVDAPFVKSWLTHNERWKSAFLSVRLSNDTVLPLIFLGEVEGLIHQSRVCDAWQGPCFDQIYHFHEPYGQEPDSPIAVGPHPRFERDEDKGFLFVFLNSNNPVWFPVILRSIGSQFEGSPLYLANQFQGSERIFPPRPSELNQLLTELWERQGKPQKIVGRYDMKSADRFIVKVALGMGALFLDPAFVGSDSAKLLRRFLWEKDGNARQAIPVRGARFFDHADLPILSWPNGHAILLKPVEGNLILRIRFYEKQEAQVVISSEPKHWEGRIPENGVVFVISPGIQRWVGPIALGHFLAHRMGQLADSSLRQLEEDQRVHPPPPFMI